VFSFRNVNLSRFTMFSSGGETTHGALVDYGFRSRTGAYIQFWNSGLLFFWIISFSLGRKRWHFLFCFLSLRQYTLFNHVFFCHSYDRHFLFLSVSLMQSPPSLFVGLDTGFTRASGGKEWLWLWLGSMEDFLFIVNIHHWPYILLYYPPIPFQLFIFTFLARFVIAGLFEHALHGLSMVCMPCVYIISSFRHSTLQGYWSVFMAFISATLQIWIWQCGSGRVNCFGVVQDVWLCRRLSWGGGDNVRKAEWGLEIRDIYLCYPYHDDWTKVAARLLVVSGIRVEYSSRCDRACKHKAKAHHPTLHAPHP